MKHPTEVTTASLHRFRDSLAVSLMFGDGAGPATFYLTPAIVEGLDVAFRDFLADYAKCRFPASTFGNVTLFADGSATR